MFSGLQLFIKAMVRTLARLPFSLRRWLFYPVALALFLAFFLFVQAGRLLDDLFFPAYRGLKIHPPIFIISPPRSGTTLLHRLLCLDEDQFVYFKTYQTLLPSITLYKFVHWLIPIDRAIGRPLGRSIRWFEARLFAGWANIHPTGFDQPEEDEGLFLFTGYTPAMYMLFPDVQALPEAGFSDRTLSAARQRLANFYAGCLQRRLYIDGKNRILLTKNVLSTGRLQTILQALPAARIIYLVRSPYKTIPSMLNMFHVVWRSHSPEIPKDSPCMRSLAELGQDYYLHILTISRQLTGQQFLCLQYQDLVQNPQGVVEKIYAHFNLPMSPQFHTRLSEACAANKDYQSNHRYGLEEFGLRKESVYERLKEVFVAYNFPPDITSEPEID